MPASTNMGSWNVSTSERLSKSKIYSPKTSKELDKLEAGDLIQIGSGTRLRQIVMPRHYQLAIEDQNTLPDSTGYILDGKQLALPSHQESTQLWISYECRSVGTNLPNFFRVTRDARGEWHLVHFIHPEFSGSWSISDETDVHGQPIALRYRMPLATPWQEFWAGGLQVPPAVTKEQAEQFYPSFVGMMSVSAPGYANGYQVLVADFVNGDRVLNFEVYPDDLDGSSKPKAKVWLGFVVRDDMVGVNGQGGSYDFVRNAEKLFHDQQQPSWTPPSEPISTKG